MIGVAFVYVTATASNLKWSDSISRSRPTLAQWFSLVGTPVHGVLEFLG